MRCMPICKRPQLWFMLAAMVVSSNTWACSNQFKPVCGYWMHSAKTQTFINECQAHEFGAKVRHEGSCKDQPQTSKAPASAAAVKH